MINILYYYASLQFDTGSPKSMVNMISTLERSKYQPLFLANGKGKLVDVLNELEVGIISGNVETQSVKSPIKFVKAIYRQVKLLKANSIDIVHMNNFGWNEDIVIAAKLLKIPVVLHCHNASRINKYNFNMLLSSKVLTCSKKLQKDITNFDLIADRAEVLYNLVDCDKYEKGTSVRKELSISDDVIIVGTVAQISHRKGIDVFIEAAEKSLKVHPNTIFIVVGPDAKNENNYVMEMKEQVIAKKLTQNIRFLGSRQDIPNIMSSLDIFLFTTRQEPFGMVITEAMAAEVPVIASRVGGIPEIISSENVGLLIESENSQQFSLALNLLIENRETRKKIGIASKKHVKELFDKSVIAAQIDNIYTNLLGK
jgi:glycosyltransferase involved in cell wall biosynthesis